MKKIESDKDEIVVRYRPYAETTKWFQYRFSAWKSSTAWMSGLLLIMFFISLFTLVFGGQARIKVIKFMLDLVTTALGTARSNEITGALFANSGLEAMVTHCLQVVLATAGAAVAVTILKHPTHIAIGKLGISREWRTVRGITFKQHMGWNDIAAIELIQPKGTTSSRDGQIRVRSAKDRKAKYPIQLKVGAIADTSDREKVMGAIERYGGEIKLDAKLLELMAPAQNSSYTELWLQALSAPPKRERLTPLTAGATLQEEQYVILDQLGVGGQGTAYLAVRQLDNHELVLKEFILPVYVDVNVRRQALERMQNEAAMLSRLDNPRIVRLLDFFVEDHRGYLVLEKIDGKSLRQLVASNGAMRDDTVIELARQMCEMLAYLQSLTPPVVHRDFTPDNLILDKDGTLKLVDFNVAQQTESTATGTVVGKHAYISPEQFRGKPVPASDIYSMGATLVYLVTGEDPEPITCTKLRKTRPETTEKLDTIVAKATAMDAAKRYSQPSQILDDIDRV